jgi:hypothetical protein
MSQPAVSGRGELTLPNGALYVGEWLNDKPHGEGRMVQDPTSTQMFSYEGDCREPRAGGMAGACSNIPMAHFMKEIGSTARSTERGERA